jgi:hypothetical protein
VNYISSYKTFERFYKNRSLIGKANDWIHGRKSYTELIEGSERLGESDLIYSINKNDTSKINTIPPNTFGVNSDGIISKYKAVAKNMIEILMQVKIY